MKLLVLLIMLLTALPLSYACTDFRLQALDGTILITRSMEFGKDPHSNLRNSNRARVFTTQVSGKAGLSWKAKYGYLFLDGFDMDLTTDGMNEVGLSFEALYLPGWAKYQTVPKGEEAQALPYFLLGDWILSNFKTVDEVRAALPHIYLVTQALPKLDNLVFPLHFSVFDASGKGLIIEYVDGQLHLYDNRIGVMTNSPTYDWHLTNLVNYVHLSPLNPPPVIANGISFAADGQGFGMVGLPGDVSPPSRFVKMTILKEVALPAKNAGEALNLAEHLINNVDIARGTVRDPQSEGYIDETSIWVVFKDLSHKVFYYRTYGNLSLRAVDLAKVNFSEQAPRYKMPIETTEYIQNVTEQFLKSPP